MKSRSATEPTERGAWNCAAQSAPLSGAAGSVDESLSSSETRAMVADAGSRRGNVESFWFCIQARDWVGARRLLADSATMTWHTSGERFLDADAIIRVNAVYPEGWHLRVVEVNPMLDGRIHSVVEVVHGDCRHLANSLFRFDAGSIAEVHEYWAAVEAPPAWRTPETIGAYEREDP